MYSVQGWVAGGLSGLGLLKSPEQAAASVAFAALAPAVQFAVLVEELTEGGATGVPPCCPSSSSQGACSDGCGTGTVAGSGGPVPHVGPGQSGCSPQEAPSGSNHLSVSGRYIEDCRLSQPSSEARDADAATALWEITQEIIGRKPLRCALEGEGDEASQGRGAGGEEGQPVQ